MPRGELDGGRAVLDHADRLASVLSLDMAAWWQPTPQSYLARVPKALALEAVSPEVAANLAKLKKDALAAEAEQRLAGTGWLPAILQRPVVAAAEATPELEALAAE